MTLDGGGNGWLMPGAAAPRPLSVSGFTSRLRQHEQTGRGGWMNQPHTWHRLMAKRPARQAR
ncbi:MAG TPA: hypothetical protein VKK81_08925 [Candidatus Binatia bacterium]|nr:hypothetical protein [Candidatus Binatia bacterium]